jgi:taurine dioxygenase
VPSLFGGGWHTDSPFLEEPPAITTLRAVEIPPFGGDTSWANCALAVPAPVKTYQDMLRPLRVHMSARNNYLTQSVLMDKPIEFSERGDVEQGSRAATTRWSAPTPRPARNRSTSATPTPSGSRA